MINYKLRFNCMILTKQYCDYNVYTKAAITANSTGCANIGRRILEQGGNIVDAAVATLFSSGVRNPERMGLGGGFVMTIYHKKWRRVEVLIARERAPLAATRDMFRLQGKQRQSIFGGLAVGVPGSLMGYWELHKRYGRLPWSTLLEPSIALCKSGVQVEPFTNYGLKQIEPMLRYHSLQQILVDPTSGRVKTEKHKIIREKLAKTLEQVAQFGAEALYNGDLTVEFVRDVQNAGGIITVEDMNRYTVKWLEPISITLPKEMTVYSPPSPLGGPVLLLTLNSLVGHLLETDNLNIFWQKLIEVWKYAYGYRSRLGDPDYVPETPLIIKEMLSADTAHKIRSTYSYARSTINNPLHYGGEFNLSGDGGTAHFNFVSPDGDAIAHTETINTLFGAMFRSVSTGIILNNTMDDFSIPDKANIFDLPPSIANQIQPGKMPLSSMTPTIIIDRTGDVQMMIGAAGGTKIISAISLTIAKYLLQGKDLVASVSEPRLHHQLMPMHIEFENGFPEDILNQLKKLGHKIKPMSKYSTLSIIARKDGKLHAKCDWRRHGATAGF